MPNSDSAPADAPEPIGTHRASSRANIFYVWMVGPFEESDARIFYDRLDQIRAQHGSVYCVADMSQAGPPTPEARRHILDRFRAGTQVDAFIYVRANLMVRAMVTLLVNAVRLTKGSIATAVVFVQSHAEAEAWLRSRRLVP